MTSQVGRPLLVSLAVLALGCSKEKAAPQAQSDSSSTAASSLESTDGEGGALVTGDRSYQDPEQRRSEPQQQQQRQATTREAGQPRPMPQAVAITGAVVTGYQPPSLMTWVYLCPRCGNSWSGGLTKTPLKGSKHETYGTCSKCRTRFKAVIQGTSP